MSRPHSYRPVAVIRAVLLAALALFLGGVVAVFVSNRMNLESEAESGSGDSLDLDLAEMILTGKGFDYEVTDGRQRLYHIRADRIVADRNNVVTLEGVVLLVERAGGQIYELAAEKGIFRSESGTADVEGKVVLTGPDGIEIRGRKFGLLRKGTLVKSRGPVEFQTGDGLTGSAEELEAYLDRDRYQLTGAVRITGQDAGEQASLTLEADRMIYEKPNDLIIAEGSIKLRRGRDEMTADRIALTLGAESAAGTESSEDAAPEAAGDIEGAPADEPVEGSGPAGSRARFVRARWNVSGSLISSDNRGFERRLRFSGDEVSIAYGESGAEPSRAEIVGTDAAPARLDSGDDTGLVRRVTSRRLEADFVDGQARVVRTGGEMILTEFLAFDPGRELGRVCGGSATVRFDARGQVARINVVGKADMHRAGFQATGETLTARGDDRVEIAGNPARLYSRQGELSAPELARDAGTGVMTASGGVRAWLPRGSGFTMVKATDATDALPTQVTAESAEWRQEEGSFLFEGNVRAWQGESFVTAQRLIGENDGRVRGEGGIQTTLERDPDAASAGEREEANPVRVTAQSFEYDREARLIDYQGSPEVQDAGRLMRCTELKVYLQEESDLERLECLGNVLVDDRLGGRQVRGSEALYRPESSIVEISGSPVTLQKPDGSVIRAGRVIYDFETSIAQFLSGTSSAVTNSGGDN